MESDIIKQMEREEALDLIAETRKSLLSDHFGYKAVVMFLIDIIDDYEQGLREDAINKMWDFYNDPEILEEQWRLKVKALLEGK